MLINKNCQMCKGSGKVKTKSQKVLCPECEFRDLYGKALVLKEGKFYSFEQNRRNEIERMAIVFGKPTLWSKWHIILYEDNKVRRVDWSWMENNLS